MRHKSVLLGLIIIILLMNNAMSFMPTFSHKIIFKEATQDDLGTELYKACQKFPAECYSANVLTDISVFWYWLEGEKYVVTHSPNFCRSLLENSKNDVEFACSAGCMTHQTADPLSHNFMVPYAIEHSLLANTIVHVFAEQKLDNWVEKNYPELKQESIADLNSYNNCFPLFKRVMLGDKEYSDVTEQELNDKFAKFIQEIQYSQTGYDQAFEKKSFMVNFKALPFYFIALYIIFMLFFLTINILLFAKVIRRNASLRHYIAFIVFIPLFVLFLWIFIANIRGTAFSSIIAIAKPISQIVPLGEEPRYYIDKAVANTKDLFIQGPGVLSNTEPSGFTRLAEADRSIMIYDYIILGVIFLAFAFYLWFLFKKNKIKVIEQSII